MLTDDDGRYYFIYSSRNGHELCCATANSPTGLFTFRGPLAADGTYGARIACNLWSKSGTGQYLANMRDFSVAGFKYFEIRENTKIQLKIRVRGDACFCKTSQKLQKFI